MQAPPVPFDLDTAMDTMSLAVHHAVGGPVQLFVQAEKELYDFTIASLLEIVDHTMKMIENIGLEAQV